MTADPVGEARFDSAPGHRLAAYRRDTMHSDPTQPIQYRGHLVTCGDCGRLHVQGVACQHGGESA